MAVISQVPPELALIGVGGSPFEFTVQFTDSSGNPLSTISNPTLYVESGTAEQTAFEVTPVAGSAGQWTVSWTAAQTAAMQAFAGLNLSPLTVGSRLRWTLRAFVSSVGPYAMCAGGLTMGDPTIPASSTSSNALIVVSGSAGTVDIAVTLGGAGGGGGGTGTVFNYQTISGTAYTIPDQRTSPYPNVHVLTLTQPNTVITLPPAFTDLDITIRVLQGSGGNSYSFLAASGGATSPSATTATAAGQIDTYQFYSSDGTNYDADFAGIGSQGPVAAVFNRQTIGAAYTIPDQRSSPYPNVHVLTLTANNTVITLPPAFLNLAIEVDVLQGAGGFTYSWAATGGAIAPSSTTTTNAGQFDEYNFRSFDGTNYNGALVGTTGT
jgi:hypothetical protein